jgi:hypothetical protein
MKFWCWILSLLTLAPVAGAQPARIVLLRHAEKPPEEWAAHLSDRGRERALALASFLTNKMVLGGDALPSALFAQKISKQGRGGRPYETLVPLAERLKLGIQMPYRDEDYQQLANRLLHDPALKGKTVVVCWVRETLPELARALGAKPKPSSWKREVYDRVWIVTFRQGRANLETLSQNLLPGDSP